MATPEQLGLGQRLPGGLVMPLPRPLELLQAGVGGDLAEDTFGQLSNGLLGFVEGEVHLVLGPLARLSGRRAAYASRPWR